MAVIAQLRVSDPRGLELIRWFIHDQYFQVDDVVIDDIEGVLTIPFEFEDMGREEVLERTRLGRAKRARVPVVRAFLRIKRAGSVVLEDTARVGTYDFNELRLSPEGTTLVVDTNVPLKLQAAVDAIDIELELTDDVIGFRAIRHLPGGGDLRRALLEDA